MESTSSKPKATPPGVSRVEEIDKRAEALRENLKKRKAQTGTRLQLKKDTE